jgi:hypothetical protein
MAAAIEAGAGAGGAVPAFEPRGTLAQRIHRAQAVPTAVVRTAARTAGSTSPPFVAYARVANALAVHAFGAASLYRAVVLAPAFVAVAALAVTYARTVPAAVVWARSRAAVRTGVTRYAHAGAV